MREEFHKSLNNILVQKGLQKDPDKNIWIRKFETRGQGVVMNVNGRRFQQPGEVIQIEYRLEVIGEGSVDDILFSQINFQVKHGDELVLDSEECIYYDEIGIVENIINRVFR